MTDYMILHASAFPPSDWAWLLIRQPKPSETSTNELWVEMTNHYNQSMARRQHLITSNSLSRTATESNIGKMRREVHDRYRQRGTTAFEGAEQVKETFEIATEWAKYVVDLKEKPMETIEEVDECGDEAAEMKNLQIKQAKKNWLMYERLKDSDRCARSFGARLEEISSACYNFVYTNVGDRLRPRWDEICLADEEVEAHLATVRQQVSNDVSQLRDFLRGRLFDQYCLMKDTPEEKKDPTWLAYGKCIILGNSNGGYLVGERLRRMIRESGLDATWVRGHIVDYHDGTQHIGQWQRYMQARRWTDLAEKFTMDMQQLEILNRTRSSDGRRCSIMYNLRNSIRLCFRRLAGAQDYELSEMAMGMEEEARESSSTTSSASIFRRYSWWRS